MDQFTMAEFAKNSENKEGSSFTPAVQEEGIEQGALIVSRLYNTMLGEITRALKSWNAELTKILEEADITPSSLSNEQLYTAISKLINQSSGHMIGEIVNSPIPLVSAGMHLLDGSLIAGDGVYAEFVDYMAELYASSTPAPSYFTTESSWQTSISQYGVCSKFVYDTVNNTLRLPKLYSPARYLIKSYTSGDDWYRIYNDGWCEQGSKLISTNETDVNFLIAFNNTNYALNIQQISVGSPSAQYFGAMKTYTLTTSGFHYKSGQSENPDVSWEAKGYVDISQYSVSPMYQYIALTQAPRTDIQIDVDNIITELNNKVDKSDLEEVHCVIETYTNGSSWYRLYDDGWCEQGGTETFASTASRTSDVVLLKELNSSDYQIFLMGFGSAGAFGIRVSAQNSAGFSYAQISAENNYRGTKVYWEAKGYIS